VLLFVVVVKGLPSVSYIFIVASRSIATLIKTDNFKLTRPLEKPKNPEYFQGHIAEIEIQQTLMS
jgi:hypothetical protein